MLFQICVPSVVPFTMTTMTRASWGRISLEPILVFVIHVMSLSTICRTLLSSEQRREKKECERARKTSRPSDFVFPSRLRTNCIPFHAVILST